MFQIFVAALEGNPIDITDKNFVSLSHLFETFGFDGLTTQLPILQPSAVVTNVEARCRI
jgi:hypothetical protein